MMLMIIVFLIVAGLCLGSFVNALVWRLHEQTKHRSRHPEPAWPAGRQPAERVSGPRSRISKVFASVTGIPDQVRDDDLSILRGRSMCPNCKHELSAKDLVPVLSWVSLRGRCRYCGKPVSSQYPVVELATAVLFVVSYVWWPASFDTVETIIFILWLALLTGLIALLVYDLRWLLLPNRIIYPLGGLAILYTVANLAAQGYKLSVVVSAVLAVVVGGGLFYVIFQLSDGKWIGGGDVKLGWLLGLIAATPARSLLFIFIASVLGSLVSVPLLASKRLNRSSVIPFGPFLIAGLIVVQLFGTDILQWYQQTFLNI